MLSLPVGEISQQILLSHFPLGENKTQSCIANDSGKPEIQKNVGTAPLTKASLLALQSVRLRHDDQPNGAGDDNDHPNGDKILIKLLLLFGLAICVYTYYLFQSSQ